jgi:hypothetical protein
MNGKGLNINMDFKQWLSEMPINPQLMGKGWERELPQGKTQDQHYDRASVNIMKADAERGFKNLKKSFSLVKETIDAHFLKAPGMRDHIEQGEVTEDYLKQLGVEIPPINRSNITIFFTNNRGAERMPLTPWTVAHRIGHVARQLESYQKFSQHVERDFSELLQGIYGIEKVSNRYAFDDRARNKQADHDKFIRQLMMGLGTMRSAREKVLFRTGEFTHELFAQAIVKNRIEFNREIPKQLVTKYAWGNPTWDGSAHSKVHRDEILLDDFVDRIEANANFYKSQVNLVLKDMVGKIFVM